MFHLNEYLVVDKGVKILDWYRQTPKILVSYQIIKIGIVPAVMDGWTDDASMHVRFLQAGHPVVLPAG